jgi:exopolysaccharide biosynthesis polyprenyl glycosylphosphotransferase
MSRGGVPARIADASARMAARDTTSPRDHTRDRWVSSLFQASLFLSDAVLVAAGVYLAYWVPERLNLWQFTDHVSSGRLLAALAITVFSIVTVFSLGGLYRLGRGTSRIDEFYKVCTHLSLGVVVAITAAIIVLGVDVIISRRVVLIGWLLAIGLVAAGRFSHGYVAGALRSRGLATRRLLIIGTDQTARSIFSKIEHSPHLGYEVVGFLAHRRLYDAPRSVEDMPVYGTTARIAEVARRHEVDEIIISPEGSSHDDLLELVYQLMDLPVNIKVYPDMLRLITNDELSISDLGGMPMMTVRNVGLRAWDRGVKRLVDLLVSGFVLVFLSPLMLLLALLIKLDSTGPVFFVQERVGHDGVPFNLLKFRSMPVDAEARTGPVFTRPGDPRPTRLGAFMRRYSLDEMPQFVNVFLGEMSLVGPRPERPYFVEQFRQTIPRYMARHREKAGITGWAQVNGLRGDTSIEERTRYDLYYVENWSLLFDIKIMIKTLIRISTDENAY